jgi:DNA-directed RNA polymerase subunit F
VNDLPEEIHHRELISLPEVREILLDRLKETEDLSYVQRIALEHAQLVARIDAPTAKELIDGLMEKFRISHKGAITLANYMPDTIDEIRQLLDKDATLMETETIQEILDTLSSVERLSKKDKEIQIEDESEDTEFIEEEKETDESIVPEDVL